MRKRGGMILALVMGLGLVACTTVPPISNAPLPTVAIRVEPTPTRPHLTIQYCDDVTTSFPRTDFQQANALMAASLQKVVSANQQGVTLYATAVTHNTFDPTNTLPPFRIPAIPAYGVPPTPVPTAAPANPVFDPSTATAVRSETVQSIYGYNQHVAQVDTLVKNTKTQVSKDANRLLKWNPPADNIASSILGCFQVAASRFQGQTGEKLLYIASDLENNTDVDYTQEFVTSHRLSGVIVHVIYFVSATALRDQQKRSSWCPFLKSAGASTVLFSLPGDVFDDMIDADLAAKPTSCS